MAKQLFAIRSIKASYNVCPAAIPELFAQTQGSNYWRLIHGWDKFKIITTNRRCNQRLCLGAWHINSNHAPLNRDDGGLPPDAYLHLVRKKDR